MCRQDREKRDMTEMKMKDVVKPTDYSYNKGARIVGLVNRGMHWLPAARVEGVTQAVWERWIAEGRSDLEQSKTTPLARLIVSLHAAEAALEARVVKQYFKLAKLRACDCAKFLSLRFPERWAPKLQTQQPSSSTVNIQVVKYQLPAPVRNKPALPVRKPTLPVRNTNSPADCSTVPQIKDTIQEATLQAAADGGFKPRHGNRKD